MAATNNCTPKSDANLFTTTTMGRVRWRTTVVISIVYRRRAGNELTIFFRLFGGLFRTENVFARPANKCYFNGNVYEPSARLSEADSALNPCLAACFCDQRQYNKYDDLIFYLKLKPIITR